MLKDVINIDKEDVFQDVPGILSDIVVTEFPTPRKDEQVVLDNCEETIMLKSETNSKDNALVIMFNIQKRLDGKDFLTMLKGMFLYHIRIFLDRKLLKEALTFEEVVQLLQEVGVTKKENLVII